MRHTLNDWLSYIEQSHPRLIDLGLSRIQQVAERFNATSFPCPVITVGGTNGKGSTVALLERIYLTSGYRVGAYTSPHLLRFNERIRINGIEASDALLCRAFEYVEHVRQSISLSYFEFTTLAALWLFQQAPLDVIILEVGLGGRLDAVNIVEPFISVITSISIDHTSSLGFDRDSIGWEKAGIFRAQKPAVCGDPSVPVSVLTQARKLETCFYQAQKDFYYQTQRTSWSWHSAMQEYENLPIPTIQLQNAATVLMVITLLQTRLAVERSAVVTALEHLQVPGRLQCRQYPRNMILDVSHNPASTELLANYLQQQPRCPQTLAIVGMMADKEITESLQPLVPLVDQWYVASLDVSRGASGDLLCEKLQALGVSRCYNHATVATAYQQALAASQSTDQLVIFGSFHTVGAVLALLEQ